MRAACILCRSRPPIENSHVIPKFAIRRLKAGNPLGTLVFSNDLNHVAQDGWKGDFLCNDCEQGFSKLETWFCREVYDPFLKTGSVKIAYGEELGLFGASVAFRYIQLALENNPAKQVETGLGQIFENLRTSLLCRRFADLFSHLYIQFLFPVKSLGVYPPGINIYFSEAMDGKCFDFVAPPAGKFWVIYVKLPSLFFIVSEWDLKMVLRPADHLDAHRIRSNGMLDSTSQAGILRHLVDDVFGTRPIEIQNNYLKMSEKRLAQNAKKIAQVPDKEKFRAHESFLLDQQLLADYLKSNAPD